jgi:predicted nucleic acid-binding protein
MWFDLEMETLQEKALFESFRQRLGAGEAACLSLASTRGFKILTDDLDARRVAQQRGISVSGTLGVLVEAVREEHLAREEGNHLLLRMKETGYFSPYERLDDLLQS